jgi:hypothetical protein
MAHVTVDCPMYGQSNQGPLLLLNQPPAENRRGFLSGVYAVDYMLLEL